MGGQSGKAARLQAFQAEIPAAPIVQSRLARSIPFVAILTTRFRISRYTFRQGMVSWRGTGFYRVEIPIMGDWRVWAVAALCMFILSHC